MNIHFEINSRAFYDLNKSFRALSAAADTLAQSVIDAFYNLPFETYHRMGLRHPREVLRDYYLYVANPSDVVDYILQQPQHTWNGVTIYPDEAWRYRANVDWMTWRVP